MVKLYTLVGRYVVPMDEQLMYNCGSYLVMVEDKTPIEKMARLFDGRILAREDAIRITPSLAEKDDFGIEMTLDEMVTSLEENGLLVSGEGLTQEEAALHLFEKCSFMLKYPDHTRAPEHYPYARNPKSLPEEQKYLYDYLSAHWDIVKDLPNEEVHGKNYKNYYVTIKDIMKEMQKKGLKPIDILYTLISFLKNQCLTLYWAEPKHEILPEGYKAFYPY